MSNFPCSLTRNITSHSMKNLAFHCLLWWKMITLQILTTSYPYIYRLEKCAFWTYMVRLAVQFTITYCILHSRTLRRSLYSWSRCITVYFFPQKAFLHFYNFQQRESRRERKLHVLELEQQTAWTSTIQSISQVWPHFVTINLQQMIVHCSVPCCIVRTGFACY